MFDYSNFGDVFPANWQSPYDRGALTEIESSRRTLDGVLFIDRVLKALGITKGMASCCTNRSLDTDQ